MSDNKPLERGFSFHVLHSISLCNLWHNSGHCIQLQFQQGWDHLQPVFLDLCFKKKEMLLCFLWVRCFFFNPSMSPCWWTYLQLSCKKQPSTSLRSGPGQRCRSPERWACAGRKRASWGWKWPADPRGEWSLGRKRNANISEGQSYCSLQWGLREADSTEELR